MNVLFLLVIVNIQIVNKFTLKIKFLSCPFIFFIILSLKFILNLEPQFLCSFCLIKFIPTKFEMLLRNCHQNSSWIILWDCWKYVNTIASFRPGILTLSFDIYPLCLTKYHQTPFSSLFWYFQACFKRYFPLNAFFQTNISSLTLWESICIFQ